MTSSLLSLAAAFLLPGCDAGLRLDRKLPLPYGGYTYVGHPETIYLSDKIDKKDLEYVVGHECQHVLWMKRGIKATAPFGKPPFITDYARKSAEEDRAETCILRKLYPEKFGREYREKIRECRKNNV